MTNLFADFAPTCSCRSNGADDLVPLLVVAAVLVAAHFVGRCHKRLKGTLNMKNAKNITIVAVLFVAVAAVIVAKQRQATSTAPAAAAPVKAAGGTTAAGQTASLPRMVDLGADKCIPCRMMAPILEEMKTTQADLLKVEFIDVWKNPNAGQQYDIRVIPTQIFYDANGKELFRHEGFFSKEDIVAKWREFGVELFAGTPQ